jgi:hypothetical protein
MIFQDIHSHSLSEAATLSGFLVERPVSPFEVIAILNRARVNFVLVGAYGLAGWMDKPRATRDVDVVIMARHLKRAERALTEAFPDLLARDVGVVVRLVDRISGQAAIDLIKQRELFRQAFRHTHTVSAGGQTYRIPSLEMALTMKFAAMISPNRGDAEKHLDAHDFILIAQLHPEADPAVLSQLGELVYEGGGAELLEMVRKARAGEKLSL